MAILKCKMCGGDIVLSGDRTFGTCEYCGSAMTFPRASDEQRLNLFNRANHLRRQGEFDRAVAAYERILDQDDGDAEPIGACRCPATASSTWRTRLSMSGSPPAIGYSWRPSFPTGTTWPPWRTRRTPPPGSSTSRRPGASPS